MLVSVIIGDMMNIMIENGIIIDGTGKKPVQNKMILIKGSKIVETITKEGNAEYDLKIPKDVQLIDATGKTIMPGLIDAHLHLLGIRSMQPVQWVIDKPALRAVRATTDVRKLIEAGFTSVRCAGSDVSIYLKKAIEEGTILGPRIIAANKIISQTGGPGDIRDLPLEWASSSDTLGRIADGVDECRRAAREQIREGADVIKICTTGGVLSKEDSPTQAQLVEEEIAAIITEAHRVGIKVMAHAHNPEGIQNAIRNGADTIEHGIFLSDDAISLMLQDNIILTPTLAISDAINNEGEKTDVTDYGLQKVKSIYEEHIKSAKRAYKAGVKIALGTDFCGPDLIPHGKNAIELELLVNKIGMTPMEAIVAATKIGSEALGLEQDIGTLETGKRADLLIVDGNPLDDITLLQNREKILVIMKDGKIIVDKQ